MCAIFGLIDYSHHFTTKQREKILRVLSTACEARGRDATGFACAHKGILDIRKLNVPASQFNWHIPNHCNIIMGHTRMTTQGDAARNYNNHPFRGEVANATFAFAHNGVIQNDSHLRKSYDLPPTVIETDSYVAVQLLEHIGELSYSSLAQMAELLYGTFTFTLLDNNNNFYFVKGENPLALYHFENEGFYIYASTKSILLSALQQMHLVNLEYNIIDLQPGDILCINARGKFTASTFNAYQEDDSLFFQDIDDEYFSLIEYAEYYSVDFNYIEILLEWGYQYEEIIELIRNPLYLENVVTQILYGDCEVNTLTF